MTPSSSPSPPEARRAALAEPLLAAYLPLVYVAWADGDLEPAEIADVRARVEAGELSAPIRGLREIRGVGAAGHDARGMGQLGGGHERAVVVDDRLLPAIQVGEIVDLEVVERDPCCLEVLRLREVTVLALARRSC